MSGNHNTFPIFCANCSINKSAESGSDLRISEYTLTGPLSLRTKRKADGDKTRGVSPARVH